MAGKESKEQDMNVHEVHQKVQSRSYPAYGTSAMMHPGSERSIVNQKSLSTLVSFDSESFARQHERQSRANTFFIVNNSNQWLMFRFQHNLSLQARM